jgi:hypothetical protein
LGCADALTIASSFELRHLKMRLSFCVQRLLSGPRSLRLPSYFN